MNISAGDHEQGAAGRPSIARASADFVRLQDEWRAGRRQVAERRRVLHAVDGFLDTVEESNLAGHGRRLDPLMHHRLRRLEAQVGRALPDSVWRAPSGHRLHEALLDWEEDLLVQAGLGARLHGGDGFDDGGEDFAS